MSQFDNGQPRLDHLPYYREYIEHILKPRVVRLVEQVRANLTEQVWADLLERVAEEQQPGAGTDPQTIQHLRTLIQDALRLRITAQIHAEFDGSPVAAEPVGRAAGSEGRDNLTVVDRAFPNNPLARAVGGVRRADR